MKARYQVNVKKPDSKKRNRNLVLYLVLVLIIIGLVLSIYFFFLRSDTKINHSKAEVSKYTGSVSTSLEKYSASNFSFEMSPGWSRVPVVNSPYHLYIWQTGKGSNYETVDIFEDSKTSNFAVNKVVIVAPNINQISVLGTPSDNCTNFTNGTKTSTLSGYPAKWMGVSFNCDFNSTATDTVGISSAEAINSVNLTSPTNAHHSFYFLYTDHSLSPNYSDFEELLNSFQLQ